MGADAAEDAPFEAPVASKGQNGISGENDAAKGASPKSPLSVVSPEVQLNGKLNQDMVEGGAATTVRCGEDSSKQICECPRIPKTDEIQVCTDSPTLTDGPLSDVLPAAETPVIVRIDRMSPAEARQRLSQIHEMAKPKGCYVKEIELQLHTFPDPLNPPQSRSFVPLKKDILEQPVTVSFLVNILVAYTYAFTAESCGKMPLVSENIVSGSTQVMQQHGVPHPPVTMAVLILDVSHKEEFQKATGMLISDVEMPTDCGRATGVYECSPLRISSDQIKTFINIVDTLAGLDGKEGDKIKMDFPNFFCRDNSDISYVFAILQPDNSAQNKAMQQYLERVEFKADPVASTLLKVMPFCYHIRLMVGFGGGMEKYRHANAGPMRPDAMKKKSLSHHRDNGLFEGCDIRLACSLPIEEEKDEPFCTFQNAVPYHCAHYKPGGLMLQAIGEVLSEERKENWKKAISDSHAKRTPEEKAETSKLMREGHAKRTPEQKAETAKLKSDSHAKRTPEQKAETSKLISDSHAKRTPEQKAETSKLISDNRCREPERIAEKWAKMTPAQKQAQTQANEDYLARLAVIKAATQAQLRAEAEEKEAKAKARAEEKEAKAKARAEEKEAKAKARAEEKEAKAKARAEEKEAKAKARAEEKEAEKASPGDHPLLDAVLRDLKKQWKDRRSALMSGRYTGKLDGTQPPLVDKEAKAKAQAEGTFKRIRFSVEHKARMEEAIRQGQYKRSCKQLEDFAHQEGLPYDSVLRWFSQNQKRLKTQDALDAQPELTSNEAKLQN